mgnify:CR=1 FL=1
MKLVSIPANPVPEDVVTGAIQTPDGVNLRFARWAPPPGRKGTVLVLQGRAEFIEKYFETVRDLRARGDLCANSRQRSSVTRRVAAKRWPIFRTWSLRFGV